MLSVLYLATAAGAFVSAWWQARLIKANRPIRHGLWLALYAALGYAASALAFGPWWALPAALGMAGVFSAVFRLFLNAARWLPLDYMGPPPATKKGRSMYDLFCWRVAMRIGTWPALVAFAMEGSAAIGVAVLFWLRSASLF